MIDDSQIVAWAAEVVATWLQHGKAPRDAMAESPTLRIAEAAERAAVARLASRALAAMRRLEFLFAGKSGLRHLRPHARALALVLATKVEADELFADAASRRFEMLGGGEPPPFANLLRAAELLRAGGGEEPALAFARRHSLPDWFAQRALAQFGEQAEAVVVALAQPAPRTLRANLLRVPSRDALAVELQQEGVATTRAAHAATALHVEGDADLFATRAFARGAFEQQDEASQLVASVVAPPPGGKVLDLCAGSGGKTLALAALLQNKGAVLATDVHTGRLDALRARLGRTGADNVQVVVSNEAACAPAVEAFAAHADRILVDAPCSGTGSWRRRPEARWNLTAADLAAMVRQQDALLRTAAARLRKGARLVYATCSLLAEENEQRVASLCAQHPELEVVRIAELLGGATARPIADATGTFLSLRPDRHGCDGFFAAVLRRSRG